MQILKDEVKQKILDAAVEEFLVNGYMNSSLRTIAADAGIAIGSIYSYFSSKEDLFASVVAPAWQALDDLMSVRIDVVESRGMVEIANRICRLFTDDKQRFFILMNGAGGSRYENFKDKIVDFVGGRIQKEFRLKRMGAAIDPLFAEALASALLSGFAALFNHYGGDEQRLFMLVNEFLRVFMGSLEPNGCRDGG